MMPIVDWALFRIAISTSIIALGLSVLLSFFKEKTGKIISLFLLFVATIYAFLQVGFINFLGVYISINTSSQFGAVTDYIFDYLKSFKPSYYFLFLPFILYTLYKIFIEKKVFSKIYLRENNRFQKRSTKKKSLRALFIIFILGFIYTGTLTLDFMQNDLQLESNKALFKNPTNLNISMNQFGPTLFAYLDVKTTLFTPEDEIIIFEPPEIIEPPEETDYTRKIDDTLWQEVASKTTNANYKTLNSYFMNRPISNKNDYTGLFKDKNLIVIMMESVGEIFINPEYYPTFYKLYTEGWSFKNAYSPRNSCATMGFLPLTT